MNQQSEALKIASEIELAITCGFIGSAAQYQHLLLSAVSHLRRLHARVEELEKDLNGAKRLVSKIWNQHPEARGTIEEGTGAWMVFGQDVETSVSAQRVTQAADHIAQDRKKVAAPVEVVIDFERVGSAGPFAVVEGRVAIPVVTMLDLARMLKPTTDALSAAPVVLPEPDSYLFQHEGTGQTMFVEAQQVDWGFEANNPRLHKVYGLYTEQQVRDLLAKDLDAVNIDRLGKALTKLGHATWVSQDEAAADIPRWVNALTSCVLETPEAAPQPQADGRDVERLFEIVRAIERAFQELPENFAINIKLANGVAAGFLSGPGLTERRIANGDFVEDINAAIDTAIAAAKEI